MLFVITQKRFILVYPRFQHHFFFSNAVVREVVSILFNLLFQCSFDLSENGSSATSFEDLIHCLPEAGQSRDIWTCSPTCRSLHLMVQSKRRFFYVLMLREPVFWGSNNRCEEIVYGSTGWVRKVRRVCLREKWSNVVTLPLFYLFEASPWAVSV